MKRLQFSVAGQPGTLGLAGSLDAPSIAEGVATLNRILAGDMGIALPLPGTEATGVSYLRLYTNGLTVTAADIVDVEDTATGISA